MTHHRKHGDAHPKSTTAERPASRLPPDEFQATELPGSSELMTFAAAAHVRRASDTYAFETAQDFTSVRKKLVAAGKLECTREAIASAVGHPDKLVFQWEDLSKRIPLWLLRAPRVPVELREDVAELQLAATRDVARDRRSFVNLGRAVERVARFARAAALVRDDREALADGLRRFAKQLAALADELEEP